MDITTGVGYGLARGCFKSYGYDWGDGHGAGDGYGDSFGGGSSGLGTPALYVSNKLFPDYAVSALSLTWAIATAGLERRYVWTYETGRA